MTVLTSFFDWINADGYFDLSNAVSMNGIITDASSSGDIGGGGTAAGGGASFSLLDVPGFILRKFTEAQNSFSPGSAPPLSPPIAR